MKARKTDIKELCELLKKVESIALKMMFDLQKYCHNKGCKDYAYCPAKCACGAKKKLDMNTAVAWNLQDRMRHLHYDMQALYAWLSGNRHDLPTAKSALNNFRTNNDSDQKLWSILSICSICELHKRKYRMIWNRVNWAKCIYNSISYSHWITSERMIVEEIIANLKIAMKETRG